MATVSLTYVVPYAHAFSSSFVTVNGTQFMLNGNPFYFQGNNTYYAGLDDGYLSQSQVVQVIASNEAAGNSVIRMWGFNNGTSSGGTPIQPVLGQYNEGALLTSQSFWRNTA